MACKRCGHSGSGSPCPVCWPNTGAINKEVTDAINGERPAINNSTIGAEASSGQMASREVGERGVSSRTPNRRSREDYNAYMRDYMRAYRERSRG